MQASQATDEFEVHVSDFRWQAGFATSYRPARNLLNARLFPSKVNMPTTLGDGASFTDLGQLMFFPSRVQIRTLAAPCTGASHNIILFFSDAWLAANDLLLELDEERLQGCLDLQNRNVQFYLQRLSAELLSPGFASKALIRALSEAIVAELLAGLEAPRGQARLRSRGGRLDPASLHRVMMLIADRPERGLQDIAAELGCSVGHVSRAFRNSTGTPLHRHIARARIDWARELLDGNKSVKEVAFRLGFSGVSAFSRAYFNATGERPSARRSKR